MWLRVAECGARSLAACQGTRQLSPQTHPVLGGKRRWGRRPCFWGNLEFATFSWVTIHSRSNSRLADVMFSSLSPSLSPSLSLSISLFLCLTLSCFPCTSYHSQLWEVGAPKGFSRCVCVLGGFRVDSECVFMLARSCVCVCVCVFWIKGCMLTVWSFLSNAGKVVLPKDLVFFFVFFFPEQI